MMSKWKRLSSSLVYNSKYLKVRKDIVQLPNGIENEWVFLDSRDSVMILSITKDKKLVMIKQYRYLVGKEVIEFPAGLLEENETPVEGAKREFEEETGYKCKNLIKLGAFYETYGQLNRQIHIFFSVVMEKSKQSLDSGSKGWEEIKVELVDFDKAVNLACDGKIDAMGSSLAILLLKEKIKKGEIRV
jgi:ADP-ribose pyrophosphatase